MRRPFTIVCCAASLMAALLSGADAVAAPPDDDPGSAAALEHFVAFAADSGYTLIDPACSASPADGTDFTYTCYAMTTSGGAFIARTTMSSGDVVEFEILAQPGQPLAQAESSEIGPFDALSYFDALFSGDAAQIATLQSVTAPGSPAEAYALFQLEFAEVLAENGGQLEATHVFLTPDGVLVCVTESTCVTASDLEVVDGQLADFAVDGHSIRERLGRPGEPIGVGASTIQARAAYQAVTGSGALRVFVEINANEPALWGLARAVYVGTDGTSTSVDVETSIGAADLAVQGRMTAALDFPGATPGGQVLVIVYPADGSTPLAAAIPVIPFGQPRQK